MTVLRTAGRLLLRVPRAWAWLLPVAWAGLITWLSSRRMDLDLPDHQALAVLGNGVHAFEYGIFALLCVPLLPRRGAWVQWSKGGAVAILLAALALGLSDEWHQSFVPTRTPSVLDLVTDVTGAVSVLAVVAWLTRPDAHDRGLRLRLLLGILGCVCAAALSTFWDLG
ncbi:MAG: VanZ family protein [Planctomycetota bacterium]